MQGLTAKVFRTYNASKTLQDQLDSLTEAKASVLEKILAYNRANRQVALLCNHQRAVPKTFEKSMGTLKAKVNDRSFIHRHLTSSNRSMRRNRKSPNRKANSNERKQNSRILKVKLRKSESIDRCLKRTNHLESELDFLGKWNRTRRNYNVQKKHWINSKFKLSTATRTKTSLWAHPSWTISIPESAWLGSSPLVHSELIFSDSLSLQVQEMGSSNREDLFEDSTRQIPLGDRHGHGWVSLLQLRRRNCLA